MRHETIEELRKFSLPDHHPSPFATPVVAMALAVVVGVSAMYANYARGTLFEELNKDYRVGDFEQMINNSALKESLSEKVWEYTIIAPTDAAFDKAQWKKQQLIAKQGTAQHRKSLNTVEAAYNVSAYDFVTPTPIYPEDIKFGRYIRTPSLSGHDIVFSRIQDGTEGLRINGQPVNSVHYADNGVIYVVDTVIETPKPHQQISWVY